jgi:DUF4097 and DUF4098 domain-containing protein YvlB
MANDIHVPLEVIRIAGGSGAVRVRAIADLDTVSITGATAEIDGAEMTIDGGSTRAEVRMPQGLDLVVGTSSGRVEVLGRAGSVAVVTKSGTVSVDEADAVDIRTSSGKIEVGTVSGECRIVGGSGRVEVGRCGAAHVTTDSGRITLRAAHGPAHAHCASGRIELAMASANDVDAETVSGRITITMPVGANVRIDTPTSATVPVAGGHDCVVTARSGSGRVVVK